MTSYNKAHRWILIALLLGFLGVLITACSTPKKKPEPPAPMVIPQAGQEYQLVTTSSIIPKATPQHTVQIMEFFNYGCNACYYLELEIKKWLAKQPEWVKFERIPVTFSNALWDNKEWESLAKLYYLVRLLDIEEKIKKGLHFSIFKFIHENRKNLSFDLSAKNFLLQNGVKLSDYDWAYKFSAGIDTYMQRARTLEESYRIDAAPTLLIGNRYKINPNLTKGDVTRFFQVLDFLVAKVKNGEN